MHYMPEPMCVIISQSDAYLLWNQVGDILRKDLRDLEIMGADERIREFIPGEFENTPIDQFTFEYIRVSKFREWLVRFPMKQSEIEPYINSVKDRATITYASPLNLDQTND